MRRLILTLLAGTLLACSSGCRSVLDGFSKFDLGDSLVSCWQANVRRPADWCWGNCPLPQQSLPQQSLPQQPVPQQPVPQQTDDGMQIEGLKGVEGK